MSRNKILLLIIALLLVTNIALLFFYFKGKNMHGRSKENERHGMSEQLKAEVGFNVEQLQAYNQRRTTYMNEIRSLSESLRQSKEIFFNTVRDSTRKDSSVAKAAEKIAQQQKQMDIRTHAYFRSVRDLCRPDQLSRYDSLYQQVIKRMTAFGRRSYGKGPDSLRNKNEHN